MTKKFPCPYCKGQGRFHEDSFDDGFQFYLPCGCCNGAGMVEIGGPIHQRLKDIKAGIDPDAERQTAPMESGFSASDEGAKVNILGVWPPERLEPGFCASTGIAEGEQECS